MHSCYSAKCLRFACLLVPFNSIFCYQFVTYHHSKYILHIVNLKIMDYYIQCLQLHIMLDNSHKTVRDNSHTDLYANGVLCCAPEFLYLEMLLEPFEE